MTAVTWDNTPLKDARDEIAEAITAGTGLVCVPEWNDTLTSQTVVLAGQGWEVITGSEVTYKLDVIVVYNSQASDQWSVVEELARRVFITLTAVGAQITEVEPPGEIGSGERKWYGQKMKVEQKVDLGPVEIEEPEETP